MSVTLCKVSSGHDLSDWSPIWSLVGWLICWFHWALTGQCCWNGCREENCQIHIVTWHTLKNVQARHTWTVRRRNFYAIVQARATNGSVRRLYSSRMSPEPRTAWPKSRIRLRCSVGTLVNSLNIRRPQYGLTSIFLPLLRPTTDDDRRPQAALLCVVSGHWTRPKFSCLAVVHRPRSSMYLYTSMSCIKSRLSFVYHNSSAYWL